MPVATTNVVAAMRPAVAECSRRPMPKVPSTVTPARIGTTPNITHWPPIRLATASSMGTPGEYVGTIDSSPWPSTGR